MHLFSFIFACILGVGSRNDVRKFILFTAQVIPVPKVGIESQASKVSIIRRDGNFLSVPLSQCKRMIPQPPRPPSVPYQQHCIPAPVSVRPPLPASSFHIKWQGISIDTLQTITSILTISNFWDSRSFGAIGVIWTLLSTKCMIYVGLDRPIHFILMLLIG